MNKEFFINLLPLVNDQHQFQALQEYADGRVALKDYAKARIGYYHSLLETIKDHQRVLEIQGAIAELKRIDTLRDEVTKGAE